MRAHARREDEFEKAIQDASAQPASAGVAQRLITEVRTKLDAGFEEAVRIFERELKSFVAAHGKDEDAALKNSEFTSAVFQAAEPPRRGRS